MSVYLPNMGPRLHSKSTYKPDHQRARHVSRALRILRELADGELHERRRLAKQFSVSERTIRRDIQALVNADFWIEVDYTPGRMHQSFQLVRRRHSDFIRILR